MGLVGSKGGTSCTRSDSIFLDKLVRYDLLMTSFKLVFQGGCGEAGGWGAHRTEGMGCNMLVTRYFNINTNRSPGVMLW